MSTGEELKIGNSTIIFGGGNSLPGSPTSWEWAKEWQEKANESSPNESIQWRWDCHFKLDYDGDVVRVSSRFYPPAHYYGPTWNGNVDVYVFNNKVSKRKFDCSTLEELKNQVETYVTDISKIITQLLEPLKTFTEIDEPKNDSKEE